MRYLLAILVLSVLVVACSDETKVCDQSLATQMGINFKKDSLDGFIDKDTIWPKVSVYALNADGSARDSIIRRQPASNILLSLDPTRDSSRFHIQLDSAAVPDTLVFRYARKANFLSPGCGFATFFTLDTVLCTFHTISTLRINNRNINSTSDTHVTFVTIAR